MRLDMMELEECTLESQESPTLCENNLYSKYSENAGSSEDQDLVSLSNELDVLLDPKNTLSTPPPLIDLSPFECTKLQQEELETLKAIYGEDMSCLSETCFVVCVNFLTDEIQKEDVIKIWFSFPPNYPSVPPIFELEASQSGVCSYSDADELYDCFVTESFKRIGEVMIFNMVTVAQEFMTTLVEKKARAAEERRVNDQQWRERMEAQESIKRLLSAQSPEKLSTQDEGVAEGVAEDVTVNPVSLKVDHLLRSGIVLKPTQFIGRISEIIKRLPENLKVIRIENVLRVDLAERYCKTLKEANESLWKKERANPHEINLKPQIAFHGTLTTSLPSIVQRGLVIPGQRNDVAVRCGSSYGKGIYLSPSADYSLGYSSSNRLVVCAALQGRIYKMGARNSQTAANSRFYCVVSSCDNEWVFFNAGQVLPCYVIQVATCDPRKPQPPPLHTLVQGDRDSEASASKVDKKAALLARARKFLPYGFGPGGRTVIEDAASFDDDEEDYGDYQEARHEAVEIESELQEYRYNYSQK